MSAFSLLSVRYRDNDQTAQGRKYPFAELVLPAHEETLGRPFEFADTGRSWQTGNVVAT